MTAAATVRLLALDVDGVMTDGSIVYDDAGREIKSFHVRDGFGIKLWQAMGFSCAIITGRGGAAVERRAAELGIRWVRQGSGDKGRDLREIAAEAGVAMGETAFLGDDWPDLPALRACAYPICPADAHPAVRAVCAYRTPGIGGRGVVREAVEHLLEARGLLDEALARYDRTA